MIFSIIVPFLNEEKYIGECAASLTAQDFPKDKYEIIFIDNGSTDNSPYIVGKFDNIKLLHERKHNVYTARNRGISAARGKIIAFTDADCVANKDWLSRIHEGMKEENVMITLGRVSFNCKNFSVLKMFENCQNARADYIINRLSKRKYYGYTNNMAVRASVFEKLGPLAEWPVPGDTEIIQRCMVNDKGCRIVYLEGMKTSHLEVESIVTWLKKSFFYGKHNVLIKRRKITITETIRIYRYCFDKNRYPLWKKHSFAMFMFLGDIVYMAGIAVGMLEFLLIRRYKRYDGSILC